MEVSMWLSICFKPMDLMRSNVSSVNLVSNVLTVFHFSYANYEGYISRLMVGPLENMRVSCDHHHSRKLPTHI